MQNNKISWIEQIKSYCEKYNIPLTYLPDIINDPKVIPMIRGKAFEFSAVLRLQNILPESEWMVDKPVMNPQFGIHDMDVRVTHKATQTVIGVECKLSGKGTFRTLKNGDNTIRVKCMRSRTLGENKANELAEKLNIDNQLLKAHNDQYLPTDFAVVITSIGNAFYETNEETDLFDWQPKGTETHFLKQLAQSNDLTQLQHFAYQQMYLAQAKDLAITPANGVTCTRKSCPKPQNCGFIPNYPIILFKKDSAVASKPWTSVENAVDFFKQIVLEKS
jgi:hypothetical protein